MGLCPSLVFKDQTTERVHYPLSPGSLVPLRRPNQNGIGAISIVWDSPRVGQLSCLFELFFRGAPSQHPSQRHESPKLVFGLVMVAVFIGVEGEGRHEDAMILRFV